MYKRKLIDIILVLLIFSLAGFSTMFVSDYMLNILNVKRWTPAYFLLLVLIMTPLHNVLLLIYAFLFRRFDYFWEKEKKLFKRIFGMKVGLEE